MTPPTTATSTVLLKHHLKALKLPTVARDCEKIAVRCASQNVDHLGYLLQVCELELIERERKAAERRLKAARFPAPKTLAEFDFMARPSVNQSLILDLQFVKQSETLPTRYRTAVIPSRCLPSEHGAPLPCLAGCTRPCHPH